MKKARVLVVIPARYGSTRLEGKPLKLIGGKPMIELTYSQAKKMTTATEVVVATDDQRIVDAVQAFGGVAEMTSPDHQTGTDRVAEVAMRHDADVVVNVQGDEPFIDPVSVDLAVTRLLADDSVKMSTLCVPCTHQEACDPMVTLVVRDLKEMALYFSKAPIPNDRDGALPGKAYLKHLGLYVFRKDFLLEFARMEPTPLEKREKLEQLRVLERGGRILVVMTDSDSIGVDSPADLEKANKIAMGGR
ncbi:MAG: 3-deoxy-manno-octulosonate cytidylyltransferase [Nitrospinota bacterium]|nr:3-deoxy-manno-octulosonate cytidylyltransferase [Nitrospinota bacterium]